MSAKVVEVVVCDAQSFVNLRKILVQPSPYWDAEMRYAPKPGETFSTKDVTVMYSPLDAPKPPMRGASDVGPTPTVSFQSKEDPNPYLTKESLDEWRKDFAVADSVDRQIMGIPKLERSHEVIVQDPETYAHLFNTLCGKSEPTLRQPTMTAIDVRRQLSEAREREKRGRVFYYPYFSADGVAYRYIPRENPSKPPSKWALMNAELLMPKEGCRFDLDRTADLLDRLRVELSDSLKRLIVDRVEKNHGAHLNADDLISIVRSTGLPS